jgi:DNA-binding CsgD family transcriptional regulator
LPSTEISRLASGTKLPPTAAQLGAIFVIKEWILSPLEKTCLRWISRGRTVAEIALLEGKSVADIESCLQSALIALDAKSIAEALQKMNLSD